MRIGLVLALTLTLAESCAPKPPIERDPFGLIKTAAEHELDAAVVILDPVTREPHCSGASIRVDDKLVIVTAAHCVTRRANPFDVSPNPEKVAHVGDYAFFIPRDQWTPFADQDCEAKIAEFDPVHDRATLMPVDQADVPQPLPVARLCERCTIDDYPIHYVSALYGWEKHSGTVTGRAKDGQAEFWESSTSIIFGWSGSPVINSDGQMVGIVSRCHGKDYPGGRQCEPGYSLFTDVR